MRVGSHAGTGVEVGGNVDDRVSLLAQVVFKILDREGGIEADHARHRRLAVRGLAKDASQLGRNGGQRGVTFGDSEAYTGPLGNRFFGEVRGAGRSDQRLPEGFYQILLSVVQGSEWDVAQGAVNRPHDGLGVHGIEILPQSFWKYDVIELLRQGQGIGGAVLQLLTELEYLSIKVHVFNGRSVGFACAAC